MEHFLKDAQKECKEIHVKNIVIKYELFLKDLQLNIE